MVLGALRRSARGAVASVPLFVAVLAASCGPSPGPASPAPSANASSAPAITATASGAASSQAPAPSADSTAGALVPAAKPGVFAATSAPPGVSPLSDDERNEVATKCKKLADAIAEAARKDGN